MMRWWRTVGLIVLAPFALVVLLILVYAAAALYFMATGRVS